MEEINNNTSFLNIKTIFDFIIDKHKQLFLLLLVFLIIFIVDYITYYNSLLYAVIPGHQSQIKSTTLKKNKQNKKNKQK
jgi:hypothetical protein